MCPAPRPTTLRLALLDDHTLVRESLAGLLEAVGLTVVAHEADPARFLAHLHRGGVDVAVVDVGLPSRPGSPWRSGLDVVRTISAALPKVRTVVLSGDCSDASRTAATSAGAMGFACKEDGLEALLSVLRAGGP